MVTTYNTPFGSVDVRVIASERATTRNPLVIARVERSTDGRYPAGSVISATASHIARREA